MGGDSAGTKAIQTPVADPLAFERNTPYGPSPEGVNRPWALDVGPVGLTADGTWQMSFGERAALEGVLAQVRPRLAVEIGTAEGGSLARIAAHSAEVHSLDLTHEPLSRELPGHVELHTGASADLLGPLLESFVERKLDVDFVLVDGDHSYAGVAGDLETTLRSNATRRSAILLHDTMNAEVRAGIESVRPEAFEKVVYFELDFVPGYIYRTGPVRNQAWGGLGLILTDDHRSAAYASPRQSLYYEPFALTHAARMILRTAP
ncbi:MAG TPA: class I SAM-dependent methyltransferase [Solirubrobacteraceae bacterium]